MKIKDIFLREIFDSRGEKTIEVGVLGASGRPFFSQVPSGKSRGENEAKTASPEEIQKELPLLKEEMLCRDFGSVSEFDEVLKIFDGTPDKSHLGGNFMLGASVAFAKGLAFENGIELWQLLRKEFFPEIEKDTYPLIFSNLINGGAHAANNLDIQEYMVVVRTEDSFLKSISLLEMFYRELGMILKAKYKIPNLPVGDEEGYSTDFENNFEPIQTLENSIFEHGLQNRFSIALDVAASGFFRGGKYIFEKNEITAVELASVYETYFTRSKLLFSIEDPFDEKNPGHFKLIYDKSEKHWTVGDDLTVTNPDFIKKYRMERCINAVIIKPNQIGLLSEACSALRVSKEFGVRTIVSHRSGETEDTFIIHLAKASSADAVKIGAPINERVVKFNEILRVYGY